jgi:hypothetical protein
MQCCCSIVAPTNEPFEYNNTTVTTAPAPPPSSLQLDQYSPIEEEERGVMQEDQQQLLVKNLRTQCFITPAFQKRGAEYDAHIWSMPINFMLQVRKERKKGISSAILTQVSFCCTDLLISTEH